MNDRQLIVQRVLELHFPEDAITRHALFLLRVEGYESARDYLDLVDYNQRREINRGRVAGHSVLDGWTHMERAHR